jgi:hypothetical protein
MRTLVLTSVFFTSSFAVAQTPAPPSTGHEMPAAAPKGPLTPEMQAKLVAAGLLANGKGQHTQAHDLLLQGLWGGPHPISLHPATKPAYVAFAVSSAMTNHWLTTLRVMREIMKDDPQFPHPGLLPRAELQLGMYKEAAADLKTMQVSFPNDPDVSEVAAELAQRMEDWPTCEKMARQTATQLAATKESHKPLEVAVHRLLGEALFHTGRFDESTKEIETALKMEGGSDMTLDKRMRRNEIVKTSKLAVEPFFDKSLALGVYHLLGRVQGTRGLVMLKLYNFDTTNKNVRVEVEVPGITEKATKTKLLMKGKREIIELTPPLRSDFAVASLRSEKPSQLNIKVMAGTETLYEKSYPIDVLPRDTLPLAQKVDADLMVPTPGFVAAWITPNSKAIDAFLNQAKSRANGTFSGMQSATVPQVRALWDELKAQGVSYVMDPAVLADFGFAQRTRLPSEVLASKNAQCLEGTILFATLMESIGISPVIVRVPGHAFVGWHLSPKDGGKPGDLAFVETTMVHNASFDEAVKVGNARVLEERKLGHFANGIYGQSFMLELAALRKQGFLPQPIE